MIKPLGRKRKLVKMSFSQRPALVNHQLTVLEAEAEGISIRIKQHIMYKVEVEAKTEETTLTVETTHAGVIFKAGEIIKDEAIFKDEEIIIKVEDNLKTKVKAEAEDNI